MNCSRCGAHIPDASEVCPSCGLEVERAGPLSGGTAEGPVAGAGGDNTFGFPTVIQGAEAPPPDVESFPAGPAEVEDVPAAPAEAEVQSLGSIPTGGEYVAPGDASAPSSHMPGASAGGPVQAAASGRSRLPVVIAVIVLLAAVVGAALYFLVFNKESEPTGPELTVRKYFDALSSGDVDTLKSLYVPEAMPPDASLAIIQELYISGTIVYENLKLETVEETADDAQVRVLDGDLVVTLAGQEQRVKLSEMMAAGVIAFKLRQVEGNWLIYEGGELPTLDLPSPSEVPPSGS